MQRGRPRRNPSSFVRRGARGWCAGALCAWAPPPVAASAPCDFTTPPIPNPPNHNPPSTPNQNQRTTTTHNNKALFALVAFASAAYLQTKGFRSPLVNFVVFTGVVGWLLAMLYAVVSCVEGLQRTFWGIVEVATSALWVVFWLAAAAALTADRRCKPSQLSTATPFTECNAWLAATAFAWMSLLLWIPSLGMAVVEWRRGEGLGGGVRY